MRRSNSRAAKPVDNEVSEESRPRRASRRGRASVDAEISVSEEPRTRRMARKGNAVTESDESTPKRSSRSGRAGGKARSRVRQAEQEEVVSAVEEPLSLEKPVEVQEPSVAEFETRIADSVQQVLQDEKRSDGRISDTILKYSVEPDNSMMMIMYDAVSSGVNPIAMHDSVVKPKSMDMSRFSRPAESMPSDYVPTNDSIPMAAKVEVDVL